MRKYSVWCEWWIENENYSTKKQQETGIGWAKPVYRGWPIKNSAVTAAPQCFSCKWSWELMDCNQFFEHRHLLCANVMCVCAPALRDRLFWLFWFSPFVRMCVFWLCISLPFRKRFSVMRLPIESKWWHATDIQVMAYPLHTESEITHPTPRRNAVKHRTYEINRMP